MLAICQYTFVIANNGVYRVRENIYLAADTFSDRLAACFAIFPAPANAISLFLWHQCLLNYGKTPSNLEDNVVGKMTALLSYKEGNRIVS